MDALESLVSSARKRSIANLIAEQAAAGLCAALAGFLLLLIAGSDVLSWPWLAVLFGGGAGYSAWRTWRGLPSLYEVAQRIDQRLGLSDTLSTAIAFNTTPSHSSESAWQLQREVARNTSAKFTPAEAAPLHMPRQTKWLGGLLIATLALLALRLGVLGSLDLRHPLVTGLSEYLPAKVASDTPEGLAAQAKAAQDGKSKEEGKEEAEEKQEAQKDAQAPDAADNDMAQNTTGDQQDQGDPQDQGDESPMNAENNQQSQSDQQREGRESENSTPGNDQKQSESNQQQASNKQNDQQSLMDKVRDSIANLMNKMQPQKGAQNSQKQSTQQQQQQGQKDQQADKNQGENQQGEQSAEKQQGNSQNSDKADQNDSSASPTNQKSAANDPKTGHGTQDGSKEIAKAQQLEAMGKLTELIGQRSKTLEGEIMMDRKSSQQHELKTAYSEKNALHREAGSDLRRDEVPVELQHYVQQYFTKIREAAPAKAVKN